MAGGKSLKERIKSHVEATAGDDIESVSVPEFGGEKVYFNKLTAGDIARVQKRHADFLNGQGGIGVEAMVDLIVLKSLDDTGEKLFTAEDKPFLKKRSYETLAMIGGAMIGTAVSIDEHEGN